MPRAMTLREDYPLTVMAGLDPAIHEVQAIPSLLHVGAPIKSGHDDFLDER